MARPYPVHEAKARLSYILRQVQRGATVTITDRGRPVAQVVAVPEAGDLTTRLDVLERAGELSAKPKKHAALRPIVRRPGALRRFLRERE